MLRRAKEESGQSLIIVAVMVVAMIGMLGLVIDGGMLFAERRGAQITADGAAMAAALDLMKGYDASTASTSALYYAARNGYDNNGSTNWVTVSIPPATGPHAGANGYAQVTVRKRLRTYFIQAVYSGASESSASSTSAVTLGPAPYALISLNNTDCLSMDVSGNVVVDQGGIMVNSNCSSSALKIEGGGVISVTGGAPINVNGGAFNNGIVTPSPTTGIAPISDPLGGVPIPTYPITVAHGTASNPNTLTLSGLSDVVLGPGIYYGGINVQGSAHVTLLPGVYIIAGGGFSFSGNGSVDGNGVMIYNTVDPAHPTGAGAYGSIDVEGNGSVNLAAADSGMYQGLLFFQDRNNTQSLTVVGNGIMSQELEGTIYSAGSTCNIGGNGQETDAEQIICDKISVVGSGSLEVKYQGDKFFNAPNATLVE